MYLTIDKLAKFLGVSVAAIGDNVTMDEYVNWNAHFEAMRKTALGKKSAMVLISVDEMSLIEEVYAP